VWWASIHGLVMLEIMGIDPVGHGAEARYKRALDVLVAGFSTQ
jgi:hypothetical protein